jgi:hypothetical protein
VSDFTWPKPGTQLKPEQQKEVTSELRRKYDAGASIRTLMRESGRSYGYIHKRLVASGVEFRPRGGYQRSPGRARGSVPRSPR